MLEKTLLFIGSMKLDFEYLSLPLDRLIEKYAQSKSFSDLYFISFCCDEIKNGADFPKAWKKAVELSPLFSFEEKAKLAELGTLLGTSDCCSQVGMLRGFERSFDEFYQNALKTSEKYGSSAVTAGIFLGFGFFVMLV